MKSSQMREDPEAGQRDWERLRARHARKDQERPLRWDRRHMKQHEAVLAAIGKARARYDEVQAQGAIERTRRSMRSTIADIRSQAHAIDPWRNGSYVLDDYEAILKLLEQRYPTALLASLEGKRGELAAVRADLDARLKKVRKWLEKAATHEDEYD